MRLLPVVLVALQVIGSADSFRDFPANYTVPVFSEGSPHGKSCTNCTVFERSYKELLTRKKRSFVFLASTLIVLTDVAASGIISNYPRSIYHSMEIDLYYNVPTAVDGWRKPLDDWIKGVKAQKKAYEAEKEEQKEEEKLQNVGTVNVSAIPLDEYNKLAYKRPSFRNYRLPYENSGHRVWNPHRRVYEYNRRPNYGGPHSYYYPNTNRRNYVQSMPTTTTTTTTTEPFPVTPKESVKAAYEETDRSFHEAKRSAMENPEKWHHHREYRERRALYDHLEEFGKMLGVSLKKCIQRAICEMKEQLLPEGESLINDIARILFTVPTEHDVKDEFTEIAREENVDCARRFVVSCPHSPLQYFQTNFRAAGPTRAPTAEDAIKSIIYA